MKFLLLAAFVLTAASVEAQALLPEALIHNAREVIRRAEEDLQRHIVEGRRQTQELEAEIEEVRKLERELLALVQNKQVETKHAHEVEVRLLAHELRLSELSAAVEREHQRQQEGHEDHEGQVHEGDVPALVQRVQELIKRAETDLRRHHGAGRQHLTQALEEEIKAVRRLEQELLVLVREQRLDTRVGHETVLQLNQHERRLVELNTAVEQQQTGHEGRNRERPQQ